MIGYRLERLDHLAKKFRAKCALHDEWSAEKQPDLEVQNLNKCRPDEIRVCVLELYALLSNC